MPKIFRYLINWLYRQLFLYYLLVFKFCKRREFEGFILYAFEDEEKFFQATERALYLIKTIDHRRYNRVKKCLKSIALVPIGSAGCYVHRLRSCFVNKALDDITFYASLIIHETTHGYLLSKGFIPETVIQHERICMKEQLRFVEKVILSKNNLSKEQQENEVMKYKKFFDSLLKKQSWHPKISRERKINRIKSLLIKEFVRKTHYVNGNIESEIKIVKGKEEGPFKFYYEDKTLMREGTYKDGKPHGVLKWYSENGKLETEANYENGKIVGEKKHYNDERDERDSP